MAKKRKKVVRRKAKKTGPLLYCAWNMEGAPNCASTEREARALHRLMDSHTPYITVYRRESQWAWPDPDQKPVRQIWLGPR